MLTLIVNVDSTYFVQLIYLCGRGKRQRLPVHHARGAPVLVGAERTRRMDHGFRRPQQAPADRNGTFPMNGPSDENLAKLAKALPTMAKGLVEGRIGGKGTTVLRYPRFHCPACMTVWGKPWRRVLPDSKPCKACKKVLTAGGTILISMDDRFVKVTPKSAQINPLYAGKIVRISVAAMDQLHALSASPAAGSLPAHPLSHETGTRPPASHTLAPVAPPADPPETSPSSGSPLLPPDTDRSTEPPAAPPGECAH